MHRFSRFLSDSLLLCACCIFLISTLNPFITAHYYFPHWRQLPVIRNFTVAYWSYKAFASENEVFLNSYWFNNADPALTSYVDISWILVTMFLLQVLTLTSSIISLLKIKGIRIIPFVSSALTILLMIQVYVKASGATPSLKTYQLGYWLTYPAIFLYLYALIFHLHSYREKTLYTPNHTLSQ